MAARIGASELAKLLKSYRLALACALAVPAAALADTPLPAQVSTAASLVPSNSVHCVYDLMSTEDREMALLLLEREVASETRLHAGSRNLQVIDRLVDEARVKCAQPFAWSSGRSDAAVAYTMNELMSEGVAQALEAKGHGTGEIEEYYGQHRAELAGLARIEGAKAAAFRTNLFDQGWTKDETATLATAEFYLEALLARDRQALIFAAAAAHPPTVAAKPKPGRPPSRATTTRRGKP